MTREDLPYYWYAGDDTDDDADEGGTNAYDEAYAICLGVDVDVMEGIADRDGGLFAYSDSFEIASSVTQYANSRDARVELEALGTSAGRECLRKQLLDDVRSEVEEDGAFVEDIFVVECEELRNLVVDTTCTAVEIYLNAGGSSFGVYLEAHAFQKDDIVVYAWARQYSESTPSDALADAATAFRDLAERLATFPT